MSLAETKLFIANLIDNNPKITNKDLIKSKLGIECAKPPEKPHWFITIALPNDRDPVEMVNLTKSLSRYAYMTNYMFSIEFYSKSGENMHIHILVWGTKVNKTKCIRDFSRKYDLSANFIDVKYSKRESDYSNRENYIKGIKEDSKMDSVQKDREKRASLCLLDYYE